jgi:hypothetical protein
MAILALPITFSSVIGVLAPVFSIPVWQHVKVLLTGVALAPGKWTATAIRQIIGCSAASDFQTYHRVLNRPVCSPVKASRLLLRLLVAVFTPPGVVVLGLDDTSERRRGEQITAKAIYRAPVRPSHSHTAWYQMRMR